MPAHADQIQPAMSPFAVQDFPALRREVRAQSGGRKALLRGVLSIFLFREHSGYVCYVHSISIRQSPAMRSGAAALLCRSCVVQAYLDTGFEVVSLENGVKADNCICAC